MEKNQILEQIKEGLEKKEFVAFYQPQYDALTGKMRGAEALARWKCQGILRSPSEFIPVAEEDGIITEIDWYILRQVCEYLRKQQNQKKHVHKIAVNFSRRHLNCPDFIDKLCATVDEYGVEHRRICVEITESVMEEHNQEIILFSKQAKERGFDIAIDDFGSGMSSLKLVHDIDATILKIDKSLLSNNCQDEKERILLESTIRFASRLNMTTIAEGVETKEQLGFLRTCGCQQIQGFYFAKPMPEEEFSALLQVTKDEDDILETISTVGAQDLLNDAIFQRFPLLIMVNLTRNSYYMMSYENFTQRTCSASGRFDELIAHGASTMQDEDQRLFSETFSKENLMRAYEAGEPVVRVVTRQMGEDGIYRPVETADYFVKSPSSDDVLIIAMCQNVED